MKKLVEFILTPEEAYHQEHYKALFAKKSSIAANRISHINLIKRSIDARSRTILVKIKAELFIDEAAPVLPTAPNYPDVSKKEPVIIVGSGPAGLFAALKLIQHNIKPILFERGKDVLERKKDIDILNSKQILDANSNYCFGEGGAGTFSDGKLYTRATKRGSVSEVLDILVAHGASTDILIDAHPHIGSDKLPAIIEAIRNTIINAGGEIHFNSRIIDLIIENSICKGVVDQQGNKHKAKAVLLATGHSAHDIFELLAKKNILIQTKPFAIGVRIEHPQELINSIQYHGDKSSFLPPATYRFTTQVSGRGVFSFCMCPGGIIVPASTHPSQLVLNGMSNSKRNSPFANSGIVVTVGDEDFLDYKEHGPLAGLKLQESVEQAASLASNHTLKAPTQRMTDFIKNKLSSSLPANSFSPGTICSPLHEILPKYIVDSLQKGLLAFNQKTTGFLTDEAILLGVESRTSSPVRIPRDETTLEHVQLKRLYPCGEGAGYAGGIVSSAIDGQHCADMIALQIA